MAYNRVDHEIAELKRVYLYPEFRGMGIEKQLYNKIFEIIKENKYKKIMVETWEILKVEYNFIIKIT